LAAYSFENKVVLVTGAGSGMGRAIACRFAVTGARVIVGDVSESAGLQTVAMIRDAGGQAHFISADVSNSEDVQNLVRGTIARYGALNYACNAAAIDIETAPLVDCDETVFDRVIDVNLRGIFLCLKYEIRQMLKQGDGGSIVNFTSVAAYKTRSEHLSAYVASKAGLIGLTRMAAMRHGPDGIRINTICPGPIDTPMLQGALVKLGISLEALEASYGLLGRVGRPDEIAEAAMWLCSDRSSFTLGCVLPVDGGAMTF
jgi:NAD(P)-dependent dehydrogenase (short-subunit alcohol dehydrogenase family)